MKIIFTVSAVVMFLFGGNIAQYEKQCFNGDIKSCNRAARQYVKKKRYDKAFNIYKKACSMGRDYSCYKVAMAYKTGRGVGKDTEKAEKLFDALCKKKDGYSCMQAGFLEKRKKNIKKAVLYFQKACSFKKSACNALGIAYLNGEGVKADRNKAAKLFADACKKRNKYACANLAVLYKKKKNFLISALLYDNACWFGYKKGCIKRDRILKKNKNILKTTFISDVLIPDEKVKITAHIFIDVTKVNPQIHIPGIKKDDTPLFREASMYGQGFGVKKNTQKALELYKISCFEKNNPRACSLIVKYASFKRAPLAVGNRAASECEKMCQNGNADACYELAELYKKGEKAKELYKKSCSIGNKNACIELKRFDNQ
jgi:hypothetical protein